jgi:hypothetical protein
VSALRSPLYFLCIFLQVLCFSVQVSSGSSLLTSTPKPQIYRKYVAKLCTSCLLDSNTVKTFAFYSCSGLLPTNSFNNVTNCTCFNCCVLKLLANSATNERQLHQVWLELVKGLNSYVAYVFRRVLNSRYTKFDWNWLRG